MKESIPMDRADMRFKKRFWAKVEKTDDCWLWTASGVKNGYGTIGLGQKMMLAHRASWVIAYGAIPNGLFVLHRCDVPRCVRPSHLFLGTSTDNVRDAMEKGRLTPRFSVHVRGEHIASAKLNDESVRDMRRRYEAGEDFLHSLAREYGVSPSTACSAVHRHTWQHVE